MSGRSAGEAADGNTVSVDLKNVVLTNESHNLPTYKPSLVRRLHASLIFIFLTSTADNVFTMFMCIILEL